MKTTEVGKQSEQTAADYLVSLGFEIMNRNWRTKSCEIDIIAYKRNVLYFVEVKFRSGSESGYEYITSKKYKQMSYAADLWVLQNKWKGVYQLSGISIDGPAKNISFIESL